jgi:hypothetical protein
MAQYAYSFSSFDASGASALPLGLSPSLFLTLLVLVLALALACCYSLSLVDISWRSFQYTYLLSYALPALASTATYYLAPHAQCTSVTALSPTDFRTVALLGALSYAYLLHYCLATGRVLREAWAQPSCMRKAFAALLAGALLSTCSSHSAVRLLGARWGWEGTVSQLPGSAWQAGSSSMALVVLGAAPQQQAEGGDAASAAEAWWDAAPAACVGTFAAAAWALRAGSLAAVAWGALAQPPGHAKLD